MPDFDVLLVAEPRFAGGSSAALAGDARAFLAAGARVGLMRVRSPYLADMGERESETVTALLDEPGLTALPPDAEARAGIAFLHHPMIFFRGLATRARIRADRAVIVAHHPPFRGDGSLQYDPLLTARRARAALHLGRTPLLWAPVSGLCRRQLRSFAPLLRLTREDWSNVFDAADWTPAREKFAGPVLTVGRHGRADPLKWPADPAAVMAALPASDAVRVRVMGCPETALRAMGCDLSAWEVLALNAEPPPRFVDGLDVFSYHFHPDWTESFGRTVAEAMLMDCVCLLDPRLRDTFGEHALYPAPAETADLLARLRDDPAAARARGRAAGAAARRAWAAEGLAARWRSLMTDPGDASRAGGTWTGPAATLRRTIGLHRRGEARRVPPVVPETA